jgi:hypothetical protein
MMDLVLGSNYVVTCSDYCLGDGVHELSCIRLVRLSIHHPQQDEHCECMAGLDSLGNVILACKIEGKPWWWVFLYSFTSRHMVFAIM